MLDTRAVEVFLQSPEKYFAQYRFLLKRYTDIWGEMDLYQIRKKWRERDFRMRIESALLMLRENFTSLSERFYQRLNLKAYAFQFIPIVGFGRSRGWADVSTGDVVVYFPLEIVENTRQLILGFFFLFPQGYMMKRNHAFAPHNWSDFFCMDRAIPLYGMAVSLCLRTAYNDETLCIWQHNRTVHRIWMMSMENNLPSYLHRFVSDADVCAPVLFREWFGNKKGLFLSHRFMEFLLQQFPLNSLMDRDRQFFKLQLELYDASVQ